MDRTIVDEIRSLLDSVLTEKGLFLVDLVVRGQSNNVVLEAYIDGDEPVGTDLCALISRSLAKEIERVGILAGGYGVTVSSPGLDRPLRFPRQYPKHVGRTISLTMGSPAGTVNLRGVLVAAGGDSIEIRQEGAKETRTVPFGDILTAKIEPRW